MCDCILGGIPGDSRRFAVIWMRRIIYSHYPASFNEIFVSQAALFIATIFTRIEFDFHCSSSLHYK